VAKLELPEWCKNTQWKVAAVCTPVSLGFEQNDKLKSENDIRALQSKEAIGKCLYLNQVLGPEFIMRLGDSGEYWVTIGIKLYSDKVATQTALANINITTFTAMHKRCPKALQSKFASIPHKGMLRIVVNFPCTPEKKSFCSVVAGDDVQVYIDQTNARSFFSVLGLTSEALMAMLVECTNTPLSDWK